jgi:endoglucanase
MTPALRTLGLVVLLAACRASTSGGDPDGGAEPDAGAAVGLDAGSCPAPWSVDGPKLDLPAPPVVDPSVHAVAPDRIRVLFDASASPPASGWSVSSSDDARYATAQAASGVAVKTRAAALTTDTWPYGSVVEHEVVLELPFALQDGASYRVSAGALARTFTFSPSTQWTPALKINQVGYLSTAASRHAALGYWLGDGLTPMTLSATRFHVVDARTGATVHTGDATLRLAFDGPEDAYGTNYSRANVYDLDLTPVAAPGAYYVVWDGVGRSPTFRVGGDVYDVPFVTVFRALLHQRCGAELPRTLTRWSHPACHTKPVHDTTLDYQTAGEDAYTALPPAATGATFDATGGYHDAGDYDKNYSHLLVVDDLVDLYELAPARFARDDLGLPESGNGRPDLLDEASWALSFWAKLQETSGAVHAAVGTTGPPAWTLMPQDDTASEWYAYAVDAVTTYWFAGAAAKLSRALKPLDPTLAATWLERARRAWTWAEANPGSAPKRGHDAYAAAELFKTTGEVSFESAFASHVGTLSLTDYDPDDAIPSLWAYVTTPSADATRKAQALAALKSRAASWVSWAKKTGYRVVKNPYAPVGYGSYTTPRDAGFLFRVHALTQDPELLEWGTFACDSSLGANADGLSWTTGLGHFAVKRPLQIPSIADGLDAPVPGLTVYGPSSTTSAGGIQGSVLAAYSPGAARWPAAELYADVSYSPVLDEFTVHDSIAPTAFAFGYLATLKPGCAP